MRHCDDAQMSVACILPKQKIVCSLVLLIKLVCQFKFSFKNYICGWNYSDAASSNQEGFFYLFYFRECPFACLII